MENYEIIQLLEKEQELLANRNCVLQLCQSTTTDYERGRIMGQIEMLTRIMLRLTTNETPEDE